MNTKELIEAIRLYLPLEDNWEYDNEDESYIDEKHFEFLFSRCDFQTQEEQALYYLLLTMVKVSNLQNKKIFKRENDTEVTFLSFLEDLNSDINKKLIAYGWV